MSFFDAFTDSSQFQDYDENLIKKILKKGDNKFRIVGGLKYYWKHTFDAADGTRVSSICVKDGNGNGECEVCKLANEAKKIKDAWDNANKQRIPCEYDDAQIQDALVKLGQMPHPKLKFSQRISAQKMVAFNVIDRDTTINAQNKHTSLLVKSEYDLGITAARRSIFESLSRLFQRNKAILDEHSAKGHDWMPFDINLIKEGKSLDTTYDKERSDCYDLTPDEIGYERYDLEQVIRPHSPEIVHRWLTEGTKKGQKNNNTPNESTNPFGNANQSIQRPQPIFSQQSQQFRQTPPVQQNIQQPSYQQMAPTPQPVQQKIDTGAISSYQDHGKVQSPPPIQQQQPVHQQQIQTPMAPIQQNIRNPVPPTFSQSIVKPAAPVTPTVSQNIVQATTQQHVAPQQQAMAPTQQNVEMDMCPSENCGKMIPITSESCPYCGEKFVEYEPNVNL